MREFTRKEWCCLNEYVEDLRGEMRRNGDLKICDQYTKYTMQELCGLLINSNELIDKEGDIIEINIPEYIIRKR